MNIRTAAQLQAQYCNVLVLEPYASCVTGSRLHITLAANGTQATQQVCSTWIDVYRTKVSAQCITDVAELERLHGAVLRRVAAEYTSESKIVLQLRTLHPPVCTTRAAVTQ